MGIVKHFFINFPAEKAMQYAVIIDILIGKKGHILIINYSLGRIFII